MPWFAVNELKPYISSFKNISEAKRKKAIQKGVNRLLSMQTSDGGFAYWPGGSKSEDWASSYGGYALLLATKNGVIVPQESLEKLYSYLEQSFATLIKRQSQWHQESATRSLYILALAGKVKQSNINLLYQDHKSMSPTAKSYLAMAMHQFNPEDKDALKLLLNHEEQTDKKHWMRYSSANQIRLTALCKIDPKNPLTHRLMDKLTQQANIQGHWGNTWVNSATVNAMASYAKTIKSNTGGTTVKLYINGKEKIITLQSNKAMQTIRVALSPNIEIEASSKDLAYINTNIHSKPALLNSTPESHKGMTIKKRYYRILKDGSREPLKNATVGDLVEVELDVHFVNKVNYVVIDDPLPATFECIHSEFKSQSTHVTGSAENNWRVDHQELRNDRALFFLNRSWYGKSQTLSYLARIISSGEVTVPPAKVEAMYDPTQYGLTGSSKMLCLPRN